MPASTVQNIIPQGPSYFVQASTSSSNLVISGSNVVNLYVENLDTTNDIFVNWNTNSATAITAVAPTVGSPQSGVCIQNNQGRIITIGTGNPNVPAANVAVVSFGGTANVVITPVA